MKQKLALLVSSLALLGMVVSGALTAAQALEFLRAILEIAKAISTAFTES